MAEEEDKWVFRVRRMERERLERYYNDTEYRKRFILRCASGGGMRAKSTKNPKVSLPTMSWDKKEEVE